MIINSLQSFTSTKISSSWRDTDKHVHSNEWNKILVVSLHKLGIIVPQVTYDEFSHLAESRGGLNEKYYRFNGNHIYPEKPTRKVLLLDKNVIFFPRRINEKLYFLHRIKPDIRIVSINDLSELTVIFWQKYFLKFTDYIVLSPKLEHEISYVGGGYPPIETKIGWLFFPWCSRYRKRLRLLCLCGIIRYR